MTKSLITRCPKCSTAFRVTDDVLSMAKGKVRCGQCFHIFDALEAVNKDEIASSEHAQTAAIIDKQDNATTQPNAEPDVHEPSKGSMLFTSADEEPVNSEWLQTLFDEDDLAPGTPDDPLFDVRPKHKRPDSNSLYTSSTASNAIDNKNAQFDDITSKKVTQPSKAQTPTREEPAPWELELAEVEAALSSSPMQRPITKQYHQETLGHFSSHKQDDVKAEPEPDYMVALHSLAQSASEQTLPTNIDNQHAALNQLTAQKYLDPLIGEYEKEKKNAKKPHTFLWFLGFLLALFALATQITGHFFVAGSQSENFRVFYRTFCTYTGCTLPTFEDISTISIQHVRIQSHPTQPNALLVNAIMTNTSRYAQPMPKIALEFFDLNGAPVAARLFAPKNYLDKDFLDITYMPPNTPIHLVIPIRDPGARAVTHQLRVFPAETKSY